MKRKMPFIAALSILCWGCSSYDYSGDDIVGVKSGNLGNNHGGCGEVPDCWYYVD